ncbi:MAG: hypothetical protein ABSA74_04080, partial [Candidatus Staskawiczbacteria bacterium]
MENNFCFKVMLIIVPALIFAGVFGLGINSAHAAQACGQQTKTLYNPVAQDNCIRNGINYGPSGYCTDQTTADQYCKAQGYDSAVSYTGQNWGYTTYDDCGMKWTGSGFTVIDIQSITDPNCPGYIDTVLCQKAGVVCGA